MANILFFIFSFFILFYLLNKNESSPVKIKLLFIQKLNLIAFSTVLLISSLNYFKILFFSNIYTSNLLIYFSLIALVLYNHKKIKTFFTPLIKVLSVFKVGFTTFFYASFLAVFFILIGTGKGYYNYFSNNFISVFLFICLLPAVSEELFYRGIIYDKLVGLYSIRKTIIISSILFYLLHLVNSSFWIIITIFPVSIYLGYLRSKYNNLIYPIICHIVYNLVVLNFT